MQVVITKLGTVLVLLEVGRMTRLFNNSTWYQSQGAGPYCTAT